MFLDEFEIVSGSYECAYVSEEIKRARFADPATYLPSHDKVSVSRLGRRRKHEYSVTREAPRIGWTAQRRPGGQDFMTTEWDLYEKEKDVNPDAAEPGYLDPLECASESLKKFHSIQRAGSAEADV